MKLQPFVFDLDNSAQPKLIATCSYILIVFIQLGCLSEHKIEFERLPVLVPGNESAPLTYYIDFETKRPFEQVLFGIEDSLGNSSKLKYLNNEKSAKGFLIYKLRPGKKHYVEIELIDSSGKSYYTEKDLCVVTPGLPEGEIEFPEIEVDMKQMDQMEPGYTIFNPRRRLPQTIPNANKLNTTFGMLAMVDAYGEVVWFYRTNSRISDFDLLSDGNLSYMTQDNKIVEMDFRGNIRNEWYAEHRPNGRDDAATPVHTLTFHHDGAKLSNGNWLVLSSEVREIDEYYTSETDPDALRKRQKVMGDVVVEFNERGEILYQWNSFDYLPVFRIGYSTFSNYWARRGFPGVLDWSHANAIVPVENEQAYLINYRYQSAMIKVQKATEKIDWIFAEPTGWGQELQKKLLKIDEQDWSWHQHAPSFTKEGNLLFFNNNNYLARLFNEAQPMIESNSHVIEYKVDEQNRTVEKVWTSLVAGESPIASVAMSSAVELPETGNILAGYGMISSPREGIEDNAVWTMVREFKHSTPAEVIWEMRLVPRKKESKAGWTLFGAKRVKLD